LRGDSPPGQAVEAWARGASETMARCVLPRAADEDGIVSVL
jgi:hypothetical protein